MVAVEFEALLETLRQLSPEQIARVKALVEQLEPITVSRDDRFAGCSGVLSADDARLMASAVGECERIDPHGW